MDINNARWTELTHAYGNASDIPALLARLDHATGDELKQAWFDLWSALCHQGDVYSASFAAVPHIVASLSHGIVAASFDFFLLPAAIEIARVKHDTPIPSELEADYFSALAQLPVLGAPWLTPESDETLSLSILTASAAAAGLHAHAELLMEVASKEVPEILDWYYSR
jgi:hypothetical protein